MVMLLPPVFESYPAVISPQPKGLFQAPSVALSHARWPASRTRSASSDQSSQLRPYFGSADHKVIQCSCSSLYNRDAPNGWSVIVNGFASALYHPSLSLE